jgi:hypothetical protein
MNCKATYLEYKNATKSPIKILDTVTIDKHKRPGYLSTEITEITMATEIVTKEITEIV